MLDNLISTLNCLPFFPISILIMFHKESLIGMVWSLPWCSKDSVLFYEEYNRFMKRKK